jgi:hypothetical protein
MVLQVAPPTLTYNKTAGKLIVNWVANSQETIDIIKYDVKIYRTNEDGTPGTAMAPYEVPTAGISSPYSTQITKMLVDGESYSCDITAYSGDDNSIPSNMSNTIVIGTTTTVPDAPTGVVVSSINNGDNIKIDWVASADNGGSAILDYRVYSTNSTEGFLIDAPASATSATVPNTAPRRGSFAAYVTARNVVGESQPSVESAAIDIPPATGGPLPATPKILAPVLGDLSVILSWTAVSPPAAPVTSYKVTRSDNSDFVYESSTGGASGSYTINTGLTAGTPITFTVTSVNANGECLVPASIIVSPVSNPEPPAHFVAYVGTVPGTVFLYWIPQPPSDGGTPVTGYVLTYNGITINLGPGVLKFFDNVAPEQGITFRLVSVNKVGSSIPIEAEIFEGGDVTAP